ncbi:hypothetical protein BCU94_00285 [Shewanella sp. 10N.286.52.C2]|uniref:hypothetical protein n=1 Tax=unclassified Shewanella TaxID=196818 RepID=UPI000C854700|nr:MULTISPECIES: hypothetical protein [unclassified Shewanella]PMG32203.1 hypothetical protein BCU94_00285 [Shewanella sp. 10N.286.52.C2]PMI02653.1 hypothetical protein BCU55_06295 [Shewanella sp. 10N.286.48.A6]
MMFFILYTMYEIEASIRLKCDVEQDLVSVVMMKYSLGVFYTSCRQNNDFFEGVNVVLLLPAQAQKAETKKPMQWHWLFR